jgi:integrase
LADGRQGQIHEADVGNTANRFKLDTKTARLELAPRPKPYTMTIAPRRVLGYVRREEGAGRWVAIVEVGRSSAGAARRRQGDLGLADDLARADGGGILSYSQALAAAAGWQPPDAPRGGRLLLRHVIESYGAAKRAAKGDDRADDALGKLRLHVLREDADGEPLKGKRGLGDHQVAALTLTELRAWRDDLVSREEGAVSKSTANRIIANLKAALNHAFADEKNGLTSDAAWRRLESFEDADTQREEHFSEPDVAKLVREARRFDAPFADLLTAAFHTGARYGELTALDVRHLDARRQTLVIPKGKTGARVTTLTGEAARWFASIAADRAPREPLFQPAEGGRWEKSMQHRRMKAALAAAKLPKSASFYTLRHTYISRAIERGMPLTLLAENVGTSVRMIEKHYAHLLAASRRELVERTAPRLRVVVGGGAK